MPVEDGDLGEVAQEVEIANGVSLNGVSLNGVSLNGVSLNGVSLNGVSLNGVSLNGVSLNGVSLNGVSLNGTELTGVRSDNGSTITISAVGATLYGTLSNGGTLPLTITAAQQLTGSNADVTAYTVSYAGDQGWSPLCGSDSSGQPVQALAVAGTWNTERGTAAGGSYTATTSAFTFACRLKTIAKCVELGYKIPKGDLPELTSCVRLLRGDYCGNGTPYTVDGQLVNLYDGKGIQTDTNAWLPESEWTPDGARCVVTKFWTRAKEAKLMPPCIANGQVKRSLTCGSATAFPTGAVLVSERPF